MKTLMKAKAKVKKRAIISQLNNKNWRDFMAAKKKVEKDEEELGDEEDLGDESDDSFDDEE